MTQRTRVPRPPKVADPDSTVTPSPDDVRAVAEPAAAAPSRSKDDLVAAILRYLRRWPNQTVDLAPLAEELGVPAAEMQLTAERLHRNGFLVAPFIVPSAAGGGTLTDKGLRWLLQREGGKPRDVPVAYQKAEAHVRAADEAARLPRAQVYGVRRDPAGG